MDDQIQHLAHDVTGGDGDAGSGRSAPTQRRETTPWSVQNRQITAFPSRPVKHSRIWSLNNDAVGQAFQILRTQILLRMLRDGYRTVAITSPHRLAGTSEVAVNLAVSLSMEFGFTTLLVDANLRHPSVRRILDLPPSPGLSEHLAGAVRLESVLVRPGLGRLVVLPGGAPLAHTAEVLRSPMMVELVQELRDRYTDRLIVFDAPPVLEGADMLAFSPHVDSAVLVVEEGVTTTRDLERSCELLEQTNVIGVVLSQSREMRNSYRDLFRRRSRRGSVSPVEGVPLTIDHLSASPPAVMATPPRRLSARRWTRALVLVALLGLGLAILATGIGDEWLPTGLTAPQLFGDIGLSPDHS